MASVGSYRTTDGKELFSARWREGGRGGVQMRKRGFTTRRAAQRYGEAQEADARRGLKPIRSDATVAEYARYWASTRDHRTTTARRIESTIKTHIEGTKLGAMKLADVRQSQVQAWATERSRLMAASSFKIGVLGTLKAVFTSALHDGLVTKSPVVKLRLPENEKGERIVPLTVTQVEALAAAMPERYRAAVITQAGLGLRLGELLGLRVEDVDFLRRRVRVEMQFISKPPRDPKTGEKVRSELKTNGSKRTLPLPQRVAEVLAAHIARYGVGEDGAIFTTRSGKPVGHQFYGFTLWNRARAAAGLPEDATTHDLRHHYATELLKRGLSTVEVAALLGHGDASLVERVYGHAPADANERAMAAMNAAWAAPVVIEAV